MYNDPTDEYREREDVVNDLHDLIGAEGETDQEKQRRYNAALHDSILWHFAQDRRPNRFESPLEAGIWVVTNDNRLIGSTRGAAAKSTLMPESASIRSSFCKSCNCGYPVVRTWSRH